MKKVFTLIAMVAMFSGIALAQDFPGEPGTRKVDLTLSAVYMIEDPTEGMMTIPLEDFAPDGSGTYNADTVVMIVRKDIEGFTFLRWSTEEETDTIRVQLTESMSIQAIYSQDEYEIVFQNFDGTVISEATYTYGVEVSEPDQPEREATDEWTFTFKGWNPEVDIVTGPQTYIAEFDSVQNRYPVDFFNWDGETLLYTDTLAYGVIPEYKGENPTRDMVDGTVFTWTGWEPEIHEVNAEENTYIATFSEEILEFTVTVISGNDTTTNTVTWEGTIEINANAPSNDEHFIKWTDGNTDNPRTVTGITSDTVFQAVFGSSFVDIEVAAQAWTFFCLPQVWSSWTRDNMNTDELSDVTFGTYNGSVRAEARNGWEIAETFNSRQGYIVWSSQAGRLRLNIWPENLWEMDTIRLQTYPAEHPENANWNFVGNPVNQVISASALQITSDQELTAHIWNGIGYDAELLSNPNLTFQPLQGFFIQADQAGEIVFWPNDQQNPAPQRRARAQIEENSRIDIHATAGGYTDKTRVIFRSNSSVKYEAGRDASKFMTTTAPIQMYFLDVDNIQCAQMVRPAGEDNMRLGYMLLNEGDIELNMPVYAEDYVLFDALTNRSYDLSETVTIHSAKGTFNNRLQLRPIKKVATAIDNATAGSVTTKVIVNGQLFLIRDGKTYSVQGLEVK